MKAKNKPINKTILFTRHAIALDHDVAERKGLSDAKRPLTPVGIIKFRKIVGRHKKQFKNVDVFLTSPILRASQTLAIIMELKSAKKQKPKIYKYLKYSDQPEHFLKWIRKTKFKKIVAVSHEPYMSHFMVALLGKKWPGRKIKKGQIIKIKISGAKVAIKFLKT